MTDTLDDRLFNWGECWRYRLRLDDNQAASIEGDYRSPQRKHWDTDPWVGTAPVILRELNQVDADEIESAVCAIDTFHHSLLKACYIRRMEAIGVLKSSREAAGWMPWKYRDKEEAERELLVRMTVAKAMLQAQLRLPAAIRKRRASDLVRRILGLEPLTSGGPPLTMRAQFDSA